jgi:hypothetical protein
MRSLVFASAAFLTLGMAASRTDYLSVKKKFQAIEKEQVKPGARVPLSSAELNAYVETELPRVAPDGIRQPRVELQGDNTATGRAVIDFVKLRTSQGKPPNFILRQLLQGEHDVSVTARIRSAGGTATVDVQKVEISGIPISGRALDFVIQQYVLPRYPDAKIGKPFALKHRMERIEVTPGVAHVVMQ